MFRSPSLLIRVSESQHERPISENSLEWRKVTPLPISSCPSAEAGGEDPGGLDERLTTFWSRKWWEDQREGKRDAGPVFSLQALPRKEVCVRDSSVSDHPLRGCLPDCFLPTRVQPHQHKCGRKCM